MLKTGNLKTLRSSRRLGWATAIAGALIAVLGASGLAAAAGGASSNLTFNQACDLYERGDFASALAQFEAIRAEGIENAAVYYNLGNCYYRQGQLGKAVASYRRALMLAPRDVDARANLALVRGTVASGDTTSGDNAVAVAAFPLRLVSARQYQSIFYLAYYLAAVFFLVTLFLGGRLRRLALYGLIVAAAVAISALGLSRYGISQFRSVSEAVVITDRAELKSGPGDAFEETATLMNGFELKLRARSGMWVEVQLPTGEVGWLRQMDIETI